MAQHSNNKAQAQQFHAISRLRQRYGLQVSNDEYFRIVKRIKHPNYMADASLRPRFLSKQSNRVSIWCVPYEGKELVAVYDKERKRICTFLPPGCTEVQAINWIHFGNKEDEWADRWENEQWGNA